MFLRFRQSKTTLIVQLVQAQRVNGTVRQRHRASLGSMRTTAALWVAVKDRTAIWQALHAAIAELAIDGATATKLMTALQARVPYVTEEENGLAELLEAEDENAFWNRIHGQTEKMIPSSGADRRTQQQKLVELKADAEQEATNADTAKQKAARLANYRGG